MKTKFNRKSGFSLVEMSIVAFLLAAIFGLALTATMQASRIARKVESTSIDSVTARLAVDMLVQDIQRADRVLATYPGADPQFETNQTDTLILRLPVLDSDAKVVAGVYDVVIYHWKNSTDAKKNEEASEASPLERHVAQINSTTESAPKLSHTLMNDTRMFTIGYAVAQSFLADGSRKSFGLAVVPDHSDGESQIVLGGIDAIAAGSGTFAGGKVEFSLPPKNNVPLDVYYGIAPHAGTDAERGTAANYVSVRLKYGSRWKNAKGGEEHRTLEVRTKALLRNRG